MSVGGIGMLCDCRNRQHDGKNCEESARHDWRESRRRPRPEQHNRANPPHTWRVGIRGMPFSLSAESDSLSGRPELAGAPNRAPRGSPARPL